MLILFQPWVDICNDIQTTRVYTLVYTGNTAIKNAGQMAAGVLAGLSISLGSICIGSLPAYAEAGPVMR